MAPAQPLSTGFQSFTLLPTIKLGPSGAGSRVGGLVHALGPCGSLQRPLLWGWESLLLPPQPYGRFQLEFWGFISLCWSPGLCGLHYSPLFVRFICARMWSRRVCQWSDCLPSSPTLRQSWSRHGHASPLRPDACLCPSYWSGWMFIFYFLGVKLPCCSIFCQFWLCEEAQGVYLHHHLGSLKYNFLKSLCPIYAVKPFIPLGFPSIVGCCARAGVYGEILS